MGEGYQYVAYGLGIRSPFRMPELAPKPGHPDIIIDFGPVDRSRLETVGEKQSFWTAADESCYAFDGAGAFWIFQGREIVIDPDPGADERTLRLCLLGPVLALALQQKGRLILHGSAVAIAGRAVGFLGNHGWGKSTVAAACHNQGHQMITDDVLAIDLDGAWPRVLPSFPQFKLWPKAVRALGERPETLPIVHPDFDKRARRVMQRFSQLPVPIARLYILGRGEVPHVEHLSSQQGLHALLDFWYGRRFGDPWLRRIDHPLSFVQSATLVNRVRISRLLRPSDLSSLTEQVRLLERDVESD